MPRDPIDGMPRCGLCDGYVWLGRCADLTCDGGKAIEEQERQALSLAKTPTDLDAKEKAA